MAYTSATILRDGNDNPIPQYLDVNDTTDSPQGTFKPLTGTSNVQLTGRKIEIETLMNAVSVAAGSYVDEFTTYSGETETWFLISIDKQPWNSRATIGPWTSYSNISRDVLFPRRSNQTETYPIANPAQSLLVYENDTQHSSFEEAYINRQQNSTRFYFYNEHDTDDATVTVKIMKIWR